MKRVIITGCSRGIGLGILKELMLKNDFEIVGTSTSGRTTLHFTSFQMFAFKFGDNNSIEAFVEQIKNIEFDFLINNAGILLEKWDVSTNQLSTTGRNFQGKLFWHNSFNGYLNTSIKKRRTYRKCNFRLGVI